MFQTVGLASTAAITSSTSALAAPAQAPSALKSAIKPYMSEGATVVPSAAYTYANFLFESNQRLQRELQRETKLREV